MELGWMQKSILNASLKIELSGISKRELVCMANAGAYWKFTTLPDINGLHTLPVWFPNPDDPSPRAFEWAKMLGSATVREYNSAVDCDSDQNFTTTTGEVWLFVAMGGVQWEPSAFVMRSKFTNFLGFAGFIQLVRFGEYSAGFSFMTNEEGKVCEKVVGGAFSNLEEDVQWTDESQNPPRDYYVNAYHAGTITLKGFTGAA